MSYETFPVINSTLSPAHLATWVVARYALSNVGCQVLKTNINHTYKITTGSANYILRIYALGHRTIQDVTEEIRLLNDVKTIINVSYPIADTTGNYIQELNAPEGMRYAVLFSFAEGRKIRHLNTELNFNIGMETGKLHAATHNKSIDRVTYTVDMLVGWAYKQLTAYISEKTEEMQFIKASEAILATAFGSQQPSGIVHLDLWYDNFSVQDNGIITFFDFDNCGNGWLVLDIGYYCMQLFYVEQDKEEFERKKNAFLEGYRSKRQLSVCEQALIPYAGLAIWIHYLGVAAKCFNNVSNIYLSENYIKMMIAKVKDWLHYHAIDMEDIDKKFPGSD